MRWRVVWNGTWWSPRCWPRGAPWRHGRAYETSIRSSSCRAHGWCDRARIGSNVLWGLALYQFLLQDFRWFSTSGVPARTGHSSGCANLQINHGMFTTYQLVQDFATIQKGSKNLPLQVPYGAIRSLIRGWHSAMYNSGARGFGMLPHSRFLKSAFISPTSLYTPVFFEFITQFFIPLLAVVVSTCFKSFNHRLWFRISQPSTVKMMILQIIQSCRDQRFWGNQWWKGGSIWRNTQ